MTPTIVNFACADERYAPELATDHSIGWTLKARLPFQEFEFYGGIYHPIPTGIKLQLPEGVGAALYPLTELVATRGLTLACGAQLLDPEDRSELKVLLLNLSEQQQAVRDGDPIARLVFFSAVEVGWDEVASLPGQERGWR